MATISSQSTMSDVLSTGAKWATLGGAAVIAYGAIGALINLSKTKELGSAKVFMPATTILVAISAWSWAMTQPVSVIPVVKTGV